MTLTDYVLWVADTLEVNFDHKSKQLGFINYLNNIQIYLYSVNDMNTNRNSFQLPFYFNITIFLFMNVLTLEKAYSK